MKVGMNCIVLVAGVALLGSQVSFAAAEMKIAVVDMQKAIQTVDIGKKARSELESEFNKKKKELQDEEASIKTLHEEYQKKSAVMNEKTRQEKQVQIQERVMKLQEKTARSQQDIQKREAELTEPIVSKMKKLIKDLAEKKSYTLVLEKNENMVLFSQEKDDLTSEVISAFNKEAK